MRPSVGAVTAEMYATDVRATAQGFIYNIGRVASAAAPFTVGSLAQSHGFGPALSVASPFLSRADLRPATSAEQEASTSWPAPDGPPRDSLQRPFVLQCPFVVARRKKRSGRCRPSRHQANATRVVPRAARMDRVGRGGVYHFSSS